MVTRPSAALAGNMDGNIHVMWLVVHTTR